MGGECPGHWLLVAGVGEVAVAAVLPPQLGRLLLAAVFTAVTGRSPLTDHVRPRELRLQGLVVGSDEEEGHVEVVVELPGLVLRRLVYLILVESD